MISHLKVMLQSTLSRKKEDFVSQKAKIATTRMKYPRRRFPSSGCVLRTG
jgi:hypothetical protein